MTVTLSIGMSLVNSMYRDLSHGRYKNNVLPNLLDLWEIQIQISNYYFFLNLKV